VGVKTLNEETGWSREQTVFGVVGGIWAIGLASAYSGAVLGYLDFVFGNFGLPLATVSIIGAIGWALSPEKLRVLEVNRNAGIYVGPLWNPIITYVIPLVMLFIVGNYAWTNFGSAQMIGGVAVIVTFPPIGYGLMHLLDARREPSHSESDDDSNGWTSLRRMGDDDL
jgi:NSS family neurotransmitter:Na+ symporter